MTPRVDQSGWQVHLLNAQPAKFVNKRYSLLGGVTLDVLFLSSLLANIASLLALFLVIRGRGGFRYVKSYVWKDADVAVQDSQMSRASLFSVLPPPDAKPIVFVGDSLTAGCEWQELFGYQLRILNRGIGGDTSTGVLKRIPDVSKLKPRALFLMIGTNDSQAGFSPDSTARTIRTILDETLSASPGTKIYLHSLLPSRTPKFNRWSEQVNERIRTLADGRRTYFVDLRPACTDADGLLAREYTHDGLHLTAAGYLLWKSHLDSIIKEIASAKGQTKAAAN